MSSKDATDQIYWMGVALGATVTLLLVVTTVLVVVAYLWYQRRRGMAAVALPTAVKRTAKDHGSMSTLVLPSDDTLTEDPSLYHPHVRGAGCFATTCTLSQAARTSALFQHHFDDDESHHGRVVAPSSISSHDSRCLDAGRVELTNLEDGLGLSRDPLAPPMDELDRPSHMNWTPHSGSTPTTAPLPGTLPPVVEPASQRNRHLLTTSHRTISHCHSVLVGSAPPSPTKSVFRLDESETTEY